MISPSRNCYKLLALLIGLNTPVVHSSNASIKQGHTVFQLGGYSSIQGQTQHINILGLIGDEFTITSDHGSNGLVGLGYFWDGQEKSAFHMSYGIDAFYLAKTAVTGNVIQENLFTNLSYQYNLTHYPIYAIAKSTFKTKYPKYAVTVDTGIGPNVIRADGFQEHSLDGGQTLPDHIFSSNTSTAFSATVGVGMKVNQFFGQAPLECGYRFFYLGKSYFNTTTNQVLNTLGTGNNYANAVICSITV